MDMHSDTLRVGLIQMRPTASIPENFERAEHLIRKAASQGAQIIALPELFLTPYFCKEENHQYFSWAEPIPGPTTTRLQHLAQETRAVLIASLFERRAPGLYHNTAVILDPKKGFMGRYRKMHIPDDPLFYEKFYFTPGDLGFRVFDTTYGKIGVLICWDQWFPEAARLVALQGAEIIFYPTAIGWLPAEKETQGSRQHQAWETIQRSHAIANGCYIAAINRVGFEPAPSGSPDTGIEFWGQSFVAHPTGEVLYRAPENEEAVGIVTLSRKAIEAFRTEWPFLRDRRIDAYHALTQRFLED